MRLKPTRVLLILTFCCLCLANLNAYSADDAVDVRLVIDVSGSMKRNDPSNLRQPAVELLIELLPESSKAGVWTFGKWVNMLIPHKEVGEDWRKTARSESAKINSVGLYTNIGEALEKAAYDIEYVDKTSKKHIILLTDGMVDIDKQPQTNRDEWRRIVDTVLPKLKSAGYVIHTIALSDNADKDLMNKLSVGTDGVADIAHSAEDLMKIFLEAFDAAVPADQIALDDKGFVIDSSVEEFSALFFRKDAASQTQLATPDEKLWDAKTNSPELRWHRTERYDLVTVKQPLEGSWGIIGDIDPESRVTVVSNLNVRLKPIPSNVFKGDVLDITALLQEDGRTITSAEFLSLMDVHAELFGGKNMNALVSIWDDKMTAESPSEGRYRVTLPELEKEGIYQLKINVDGKTFTREVKHRFTLRQPFVAEVRKQFDDSGLNYVLTVNTFKENLDFEKTHLVATITTPDKRRLVRPLVLSELDTWGATLATSAEGLYTAFIQVKGLTNTAKPFSYDLAPLEFNYSLEGGLVEQEKPFVEETPEPEPTPTPTQEPIEPFVEVPIEESEAPPESLPSWMIYAGLGLGNLILLLGGFFIFKKIMSSPKDDILDELNEATEASSAADAVASEPETMAMEDDDEEEPPMEDLDPETVEDIPAVVLEPEPPELLEPEEVSVPEKDSLDTDTELDLAEEALNTEDDIDGMDDLDAMSMEVDNTEPEIESDEGEEEDDMVTAMLKAQGLDLAEEELDDAISSLIDDLDDDDDDQKP